VFCLLLLISFTFLFRLLDYAVWQELSENLSTLTSLYRSELFFPKFQLFLLKLYTKQYNTLGWEPTCNESGRTGTLRATIISMMSKAGDNTVNKKAFDIFQESINNPETVLSSSTASLINGDLRSTIYRCAIRYNEQYVYNELKVLYEHSTFPEEQRDCLLIMGCVKNEQLQDEMIEYIFNSGMVRSQDFATPLSSLVLTTDNGSYRVWEYFQTNYSILRSKYESGPIWAVLVSIWCSGLSQSISNINNVEEYFNSPKTPANSGSKRLQQVLESLRTKVIRRERDRLVVTTYLQNRFPQ
jgi:ERAP1-like C-terminal domain